MEENKLPLVELTIDLQDDDTGVYAISFVDDPATEIEWYAFNKDSKPVKFASDDNKQMITAPIMLADTPIYRYSKVMGEYNVIFRKDTIMDMMKKYRMTNIIDSVNEQHNPDVEVEGVYLVESFIVDDRITMNAPFDKIPEGSWMGTYYIEDKEYYNKLVSSDDFNGFSLEGTFDNIMVEDNISDEYIIQYIKEQLAKINKK